MTRLNDRDKRALLLLGGALPVALAVLLWPSSRNEPVLASSASVATLEKQLARLQDVARQKPRTAAEAEATAKALAEVEKGLLKAATPALASAEMQQLMKEMLRGQGINMQGSEFGVPKAVGENYAQVPLTVVFNCAVEQWINLMSALRNAPQVLSTVDVRLSPGDQKNKLMQVRMVVAGYIPVSLLPAAKGTEVQ